jgi:hypothetical protein
MLPDQSQTTSSVALLQNKITELRNEIVSLRATRDLKQTLYNISYQDYLASRATYDKYQADKISHINALQRYDAISTPIKNL